MTGGQAVDGQLTVAMIAQQLVAEAAQKVVIVADDPLSSVVLGSGQALDNLDILKEVCID